MADASNVVRPDFKNKTIHRQSTQIKTVTQASPLRVGQSSVTDLLLAKKDAGYFLAQQTFIAMIEDTVEEMLNFIFDVECLDRSSKELRVRQAEMKTYPLEKICYAIRLNDKKQWEGQPIYFGALALEFQARVGRIRTLLPDGV